MRATAPDTLHLIADKNQFRRTREDHSRETAEDYVEMIRALIEEHGEARRTDLADRIGVSKVTVSKTIQRLVREGLVTGEPYRSVFLTPEGEALAVAAQERHKVVVEFLIRLGVDEQTANVDAEGIEHHVSEATLAAMRTFRSRQP